MTGWWCSPWGAPPLCPTKNATDLPFKKRHGSPRSLCGICCFITWPAQENCGGLHGHGLALEQRHGLDSLNTPRTSRPKNTTDLSTKNATGLSPENTTDLSPKKTPRTCHPKNAADFSPCDALAGWEPMTRRSQNVQHV